MKYVLVNDEWKDNYAENYLRFCGVEDLESFLNPKPEHLQDPSDLEQIDLGFKLLSAILEDREAEIFILVDPDVDGYTSAAIMYQYIQKVDLEKKIIPIFHTAKQHGLQDSYEEILKKSKAGDLIICPDSSSNDEEYHKRLLDEQRTLLVLDHHLINMGEKLSQSAIVINNQTSPKYKNKELTGAGVVFQFCRYCDKMNGTKYAEEFWDLAALGIIADVASIIELENRYIIRRGFDQQYGFSQNFFFKTMIEKQAFKLGSTLTPIGVAFYIVPLINAMIRVGTMEEKERLFYALVDGRTLISSRKRGAKGEMVERAVESARECTNAKSKQTKIIEEAEVRLKALIEENNWQDNSLLVVEIEKETDWLPTEVTGLVAARLATYYGKPTLIGRINGDTMSGSGRNVSGSELESLKDFLEETELTEFVSGHDNAHGWKMKTDNKEALLEKANVELAEYNFLEKIYNVNFIKTAKDPSIAKIIQDFAQYETEWGHKLPEPMIVIEDIHVYPDDIRIQGKNQDSVKMEIGDIAIVFFKAKDFIKEMEKYDYLSITVVGRPNLNEWGGYVTPQILGVDYEITDGGYVF